MRFCDGFEYGLNGAITGNWAAGTITVVSTAGHHHVDFAGNGGAYSAQITNGLTHVFGVGDRWVHFALLPLSADNSFREIIATYRSGTKAVVIQYQANTGTLKIVNGAGTTLATSAAAVVPYGVWNWFWVDFNAKNSAGNIDVYINGSTSSSVSATGDTTSGATDGWDQLGIADTNLAEFDDVVTYTDAEKAVFAAGTYPELYVAPVLVTSDITNTFISGTYASADEIPWSSADYAESTTVGQELICGVTGLAWTPSAVRGVSVMSYVARDGLINQFGHFFSSGGYELQTKQKCKLATTAALPACTASGSGTGKKLTINATGTLTVDSVLTALNDSILVKDQVTTTDNGVYTVTTAGAVGVQAVLTRRTDWDGTAPEVNRGDIFPITAGTVNTDTFWKCTTADTITIDTTGIAFAACSYISPTKTGAGAGTYVQYQSCYPTNPNGDIAWTYTAVQAAHIGIQTQAAL